MLDELCKYENLGTPGFHFELLEALSKNTESVWTEHDVAALFHNRAVDGRDIFDGCLPLLIFAGIIVKTSKPISRASENGMKRIRERHCFDRCAAGLNDGRDVEGDD